VKVTYGNHVKKKLKDKSSIKRHYGSLAPGIMLCLSVLDVADNLEEVPTAMPTCRHKLDQNYKGCWGLWITKNWRMILEPVSGTEPSEIVEVKIISIEDYH